MHLLNAAQAFNVLILTDIVKDLRHLASFEFDFKIIDIIAFIV